MLVTQQTMEYVLRGTKMVFGDRSLRKYLFKPLFWTILLYLTISFTAASLAVGPLSNLLDRIAFIPDNWTEWIARILFFLAWTFVGGPIFFGLNGMLSGILWDELSLAAEEKTFGSAPQHRTGFRAAWADTFRRLPLTVGVAILSFFLGIFGIGWASIWPVGRLCLYDFTAAAYTRRALYYPQQKEVAKRLRKGFGFSLTCGLISLFPLINLIALPGCVVGATLMVREDEMSALTPRR